MELIAFYFFIIILMTFLFMSSVLVYHFSRFRLSKEHHNLLIMLFLVVSVVFVIIEFSLFLNIDWDSLKLEFINSTNFRELDIQNDLLK